MFPTRDPAEVTPHDEVAATRHRPQGFPRYFCMGDGAVNDPEARQQISKEKHTLHQKGLAFPANCAARPIAHRRPHGPSGDRSLSVKLRRFRFHLHVADKA